MWRRARYSAATTLAKRSAEIVVAARELYEEKGLARTSIQDITNHVGVTRSLFYHYFQNKEEVTSAVLDQYITDFLEAQQHGTRARRRWPPTNRCTPW